MKGIYLIFTFGGVLILSFGVILYKFKKIELLSQYEKHKRYDKVALGKFSGKLSIITGCIIIISSLLFWGVESINPIQFLISYIALFISVVTWFAIRLSNSVRRFEQ